MRPHSRPAPSIRAPIAVAVVAVAGFARDAHAQSSAPPPVASSAPSDSPSSPAPSSSPPPSAPTVPDETTSSASPAPSSAAPVPTPAPSPAPAPQPEPAAQPAQPSEPVVPAVPIAPPPLDATEIAAIGATADTLARFPGSGTVVTDREIFRVQPYTTNEIVRRMPGAVVRPSDENGLRLDVGIRGLDPTYSRYVTVLEDGIPIALTPYGNTDTLYAPPIEQVQRIELVRGVGSVIFGPGTMGGVLNFVTAPPPRNETWSLRAFGGAPFAAGAQAMYGTSFGNAGFIATITRRQGDGFRSNPWEQSDVLSKFRLVLSPRSEIVVRLGATDEGATLSSTGLTQGMFDNEALLNPTSYDWYRLRRFTVGLTHAYRITEDIRLRTLLYAAITDRAQYTQLFDRTPVADLAYAHIAGPMMEPGDTLYFRDANRVEFGEYQFFGLEPRLQAGFRLSGFRNELNLGARVLAERTTESWGLGGTQFARSGDVEHAELREGVAVAAYLQDRVYLTDQLRVTGAVRIESLSASRLYRRDQSTDVNLLANGGFTQVIPGAAVSYSTGAITTWAGVHLGWQPPHLDEALDPYQPMRQVAAEQSINYEIGARVAIENWLRAEAAGFYIDLQNPIVFELLPTGTYGFTNGDPRRNIGGEALVSADFGRLAHLGTDVFASVRYMFVDARYAAGPFSGNVVPYAPAHTLVASAGLDHPIGVTVTASWLFVSSQFADPANTDAPSPDGRIGTIPVYNVVDLAASYTHRDTGLGIGVSAKDVIGYPLGNAYIASRAPDGIVPAGFAQIMVTARWDH